MSRPSLRWPLVAFGALVILFTATVPGTGSAFRNVKEGQPAVPIALKDPDGKDVSFDPKSGKITVLSFVRVSQDRSRDQIRDLVALHRELGPKGVEFLLVASYTDTPEEVKKVVSELGVAFPVGIDRDQKAYGDYGLFILPSTGVVGKDGTFVFEYSSHGRDFKDVVGGRVKVLAGLLSEEEYKKSITPVETAARSKEENEAARLVALGQTLLRRGMPDKAAEKFAKAVELDPKSAPARIAYGEALVAAKKPDEALAQFRKAAELAPDSKEAQIGVGAVLLEKGETDKAIETLAQAATLNPKPEKAHYWLGVAYEKKGDLQNAVKFYRKAVEKLLRD